MWPLTPPYGGKEGGKMELVDLQRTLSKAEAIAPATRGQSPSPGAPRRLPDEHNATNLLSLGDSLLALLQRARPNLSFEEASKVEQRASALRQVALQALDEVAIGTKDPGPGPTLSVRPPSP